MSTEHRLHADGEYEMPSAEAMLAGTLALMTGHAQSACTRQRGLMAKKIVSNLFFLSQHPSLSPHFKAVADRMRPHWLVLAQSSDVAETHALHTPTEPQPLWHAAATRVQ